MYLIGQMHVQLPLEEETQQRTKYNAPKISLTDKSTTEHEDKLSIS